MSVSKMCSDNCRNLFLGKCRGLYTLGILFLLSVLSSSVEAQTKVYELVEFRLFLQRQAWGRVQVMCADEEYLVSLIELSHSFEYRIEWDSVARIVKGTAYSADSDYVLNGDILRIGDSTQIITNDIYWDPIDGFPYVSDKLLAKLHSLKIEWTPGSLGVNMVAPKTVPAMARDQEKRRMQRLLKEREQRRLGNIDTLQMRNFKLNSIGYSLAPYFNSNDPLLFTLRGNLGGELLRGSFGINYDYSSVTSRAESENLTFGWSRKFLTSHVVKSLNVYHDYSDLLTTTAGYVTGVSVSNQSGSSYLARSYKYQGKTIPNADVEIYSNGQLFNIVRSDSMGHYDIDVPTYTGDNKISSVSYDSYGVPVSSEEMIYVPPDMQAKGILGYRLATGVADDGSVYIAPMLAYGATSFMTLSLGNETVIHPYRTTSIAIISAKLSILRNIRLDLNYVPTVRYGALFSGSIKNIVNGNVLYERYNSDQNIIWNAPLERFQVTFNGSLPFKLLHGNYYAALQNYTYNFGKSFSTYLGFYFWWRRLTFNASINTDSPTMSVANPTYSVRVGCNISHRWYNEFSGEYRQNLRQTTLRNRLNYQFRGQVSAFIEANYQVSQYRYGISCGFSWRTSWMQLRAGSYNSGNFSSGYVGASGSVLLHDCSTAAGNDRYVAGSSLLIIPFVDYNGNREHDGDEPILNKTTVVMRGSAEQRITTKGILLANIPADYAFKLVIPRQSFEDISWQIIPVDTSLMMSARQSRSFYVPVRVLSELAGQVYTISNGMKRGVEGINMRITNLENGAVSMARSDEWGFYSVIVVCGKYTIEPDLEQLAKHGLRQVNKLKMITIDKGPDGVQIDNLDINCDLEFEW